MAISINKELLIKIPGDLYKKAKKICDREYKTMSMLVRELLLEKIQDQLSPKEIAVLEKSRQESKQGKGVPWRTVKRG